MAKYKVMYVDNELPDISIENEVLSKIDASIVKPKSFSDDDLAECGKDCDAIIVNYAEFTKPLIDKFEKCKIISLQGIGFNNVDVEAASAKKIMVTNCPDYCLNEVADHTIALALTYMRKTAAFNTAVRKGIWNAKSLGPLYRLQGMTFALYGFGNIARKVADRALAFGFKVAVYDPYVQGSAVKEAGAEQAGSLEQLAAMADIFSIHVPLTKETRGTVNHAIFEKMKPECVLINTSRGPVVSEKDLIAAIENNAIAAACLDVFDEEPLPADNRLLQFENVILTPHISYYTEESGFDLKRRAAEEVANTLINGHPTITSFVNRKDFGF
jgi:D-3-phosphoglycerate dehydrogenase